MDEKRQNGGNGSHSDNPRAAAVGDLKRGVLVTSPVSTNGTGNSGIGGMFKRDTSLISRVDWDSLASKFPIFPDEKYPDSKVLEMENYAAHIKDLPELSIYSDVLEILPLKKSPFMVLEDIVQKMNYLIKGGKNGAGIDEGMNWFPFEGFRVSPSSKENLKNASGLLNRFVYGMGNDGGKRILPLPYIYNRRELDEGKFDVNKVKSFFYALRYTDSDGNIIPVENLEEFMGNAEYLRSHLDKALMGMEGNLHQKLNFVLLQSSEFKYLRQCMYGVESVLDNLSNCSEKDSREILAESARKLRLQAMKAMDQDDPSGVKVRKMLADAITRGASDIHIIPFIDETDGDEPKCQISFRVDGHMRSTGTVPLDDGARMINAIMTATGQTAYNGDRLEPCDADIRLDKLGFEGYIIRGSTIPSFPVVESDNSIKATESFSGRIAQVTGKAMALENLGLPKYAVNIAKDLVSRRDGITYFIGATNTGKTTTLYALIREANPSENVILTLESPIERIIKGVAHSQVGGEKYTLTKGLRAMVRHDPDIILVGEVRDFETADAAIQASLTGHLVFTTLHARTDFDAIKRLTGLVGRDASKDYLLTMSMTLNCLWAQRLAAKLCMDCRVAEGDGRKQFAEALGYSLDEFKTLVPEPFPVYRSSGGFLPNHDKCFKCNGYGERGMQVISQILPMTPDVRELIASGESNETRYLGVARRAGMLTFPELAALYVRDGTISLEEASGIAPFWEMRERKDLIVQMLNSYRSDWKEVAENPFILK